MILYTNWQSGFRLCGSSSAALPFKMQPKLSKTYRSKKYSYRGPVECCREKWGAERGCRDNHALVHRNRIMYYTPSLSARQKYLNSSLTCTSSCSRHKILHSLPLCAPGARVAQSPMQAHVNLY